MAPRTLSEPAEPAGDRPATALNEALAWLKQHASASVLEGMAPRYGIHTNAAFGVSMANMQVLAKRLGKDHDLAAGLWASGWYEARIVASMVDEPAAVTPEQMDRWCGEFDNWAICDTTCFNLFDRTPHAWRKVEEWASRPDVFVKRTAFALLWSLALHDKAADDIRFIRGISLIEREAHDDRNLVKKSVAMALRAIGKRNPALTQAAIDAGQRLCASELAASRWVGNSAIKTLRGF
jgi:3-methyladenine DNA glycosylase AlkD